MDLLPLFQWFEASWLGNAVRLSLWLFPAIECVHLLGLALLGGSVLVVDMRLLGFGLRSLSVREVAREAERWMLGAIAVMLATGIPLFLSEAVKCYYSPAFWVKITTLPVAIAFALTVRRNVAGAEQEAGAAMRGAVALASLALWFTVAAAGRWIGFS
jgi:hypothetical protein